MRPGPAALRLSGVCLMCALLAAAATAQTGPPAPPPAPVEAVWKEVVSPEGRFSVLMIGAAKQGRQERDTALGKLVMNTHFSIGPAGGFGVAYTDFPSQPETLAMIAAVLNGARDHLLATDKANKLLSEQELTVEGHAAREWLIVDTATDTLYRARTFMAGARLYQIILLTSVKPSFVKGQPSARPEDRDGEYEAMSKKFFGSFKLLPAGGGKND